MSARIRWDKGGEATVLAISTDAISLVSSVPWPPGARLSATLLEAEAAGATAPATLKIKVHGSKKRDDGAFAIEGRPIDMPRTLRESIAASVARATCATS